LWKNNSLILHHDAPSYTILMLICQKLNKFHSSSIVFARFGPPVIFFYFQNSNYHFVESVLRDCKKNSLKELKAIYLSAYEKKLWKMNKVLAYVRCKEWKLFRKVQNKFIQLNINLYILFNNSTFWAEGIFCSNLSANIVTVVNITSFMYTIIRL